MSKATLQLWIVGVTILLGLASAGYAQKITRFDPPGSTATYARAINSDGQIAGYYTDAAGTHGFLRHKDGTFASFDATGSTSTSALAINSEGQIAGVYTDAAGQAHGFLRQRDGTITPFDPTDSHRYTIPKTLIRTARSQGITPTR